MVQLNRFAEGTDVGARRNHNEDSYFSDPELGLWMVADGMGGHEAGEVASAIAVRAVGDAIGEGRSMREALNEAHHAVVQSGKAIGGKGVTGMGSTCVVVRLNGHEYDVAWVGDSRVYMWDGHRLELITHDHTYVQSLVDIGAISPADANTHPDRSILTQCLGSLSLEEVNVGEVKGTFYRDHKLLLCSDGLTGEVSEDSIIRTLQESRDDEVAVDRLIISALMNGGSDNVTVILISALEDAPVSPLLGQAAEPEASPQADSTT